MLIKKNIVQSEIKKQTAMTKKTVTVLGALGAQGSSVIKSLLEEGPEAFTIRAVTRSVDSDSAKALKQKGVEVVAGDTKKPESLSAAFEGADAAFIVVNFWDPDIFMKEEVLTKAILDVAKNAGVPHVIYSSIADVDAVSGGKFNVPHFTMKAKALEHARSLGFPYLTDVEAAMYYSNFFTFMKPQKEEDGTLVWSLPSKGKISAYDPNTGTGPAVVTAIKDPEAYNGKEILLEADLLSCEEMVEMMGTKVGVKAKFQYIEPKVFAGFGFPGAEELAEMFEWFDQYGYYGPETEQRKHASGKDASGAGKLLTFQQWLDTEAYKNFGEL